MACSKTLFFLRAGDVSPSYPPLDARLQPLVSIASNPPSDGLPNGSVLSDDSRYNELPHKLLVRSSSPRHHRVSSEPDPQGILKNLHTSKYIHTQRLGICWPRRDYMFKESGQKIYQAGFFSKVSTSCSKFAFVIFPNSHPYKLESNGIYCSFRGQRVVGWTNI